MTLDIHAVVMAIMALLILIDVSYLSITKQPVPELLSNLAFTVFGYYFGRRTTSNTETRKQHSEHH